MQIQLFNIRNQYKLIIKELGSTPSFFTVKIMIQIKYTIDIFKNKKRVISI
jgi:hypothetical protein